MSRRSTSTLVGLLCLLKSLFADPIQFPELFTPNLVKEHKTDSVDYSVGNKDVKIGDLSTLQHGVSGEVFVRDEKTLVIKNFNYDGAAPDAFFVVGSAGTPTTFQDNDAAILAYPFEGVHYDYTDEEAPVLSAAANEEVILSLPPSLQVSELKWVSVWCRKFSVDFGNLIFRTEPEVKCTDYSFDFEFDTPVISAFKITNRTDNGELTGPCESVVTEECEIKTEEECKEEIIEECSTKLENQCENVCNGDECEEVCREIPIQTCDNIKNIECTPVPREVCTNVTTENCHNNTHGSDHQKAPRSDDIPSFSAPIPAYGRPDDDDDDDDDGYDTTQHYYGVPHEPGLYGDHYGSEYAGLYSAYRHASYSYLFFPYIQVYKAPNVVRAERNVTAKKNYAPGYDEASPYDVAERPLGSHINNPGHEEQIGSHLDKPQMPSLVQSSSIIEGLKTNDMSFNVQSQLEGCYPMVMPLMSTLSSFFVNLARSDEIDIKQDSSEIDRALQVYEPKLEEYTASYNLFQMTLDWIRLINTAMESSHIYKDCRVRKFFGMIGSYYGVSLRKDFAIAKCDIQQSVPKCWNEFKESMENETFFAEDEGFHYENMTVDSIFFDFDDSTISVGEYNITEVLDYNITDVVYAKLDSLGDVTETVTEVKDTVYSKLRSGYESVMKSRSSLGLYFDMYSPALETVNKLRSYRAEARQYDTAYESEGLTEIELEHNCNLVNSSNAQICWQLFINKTFKTVDKDYVNSNLAGLDLTLIAYFTEFQITLSIALSVATAMLFGFKDPMEQTLPCLYDIIVHEDLQFDMEGVQNSTSFFQSLVVPFGREQFSSLPVRLVESVITIISHEQLQPALANVTEAMVEKLSDMIEQGDLAERISNRSSDLKDWLMSLDILKVLEGVVELMKTVLRYRWEFMSGNWPELTLLMDTIMERIEGEYFWTSLAEIMRGVVIERWDFVNVMVEDYLKPSYLWLVTSMEWLAEDVEGNIQSLTETIRRSDGPECLWRYWRSIDEGVGQHFVCQESVQPEDLFQGVYHFLWSCMAYLEPSFKVFSPESLCRMFNLCHENEDRELRDIIEASKIREAMIDIHTPVLEVKRALMCRVTNINKSYWEYVLY